MWSHSPSRQSTALLFVFFSTFFSQILFFRGGQSIINDVFGFRASWGCAARYATELPRARGVLSLRLSVAADGTVEKVRWLADSLVPSPGDELPSPTEIRRGGASCIGPFTRATFNAASLTRLSSHLLPLSAHHHCLHSMNHVYTAVSKAASPRCRACTLCELNGRP